MLSQRILILETVEESLEFLSSNVKQIRLGRQQWTTQKMFVLFHGCMWDTSCLVEERCAHWWV